MARGAEENTKFAKSLSARRATIIKDHLPTSLITQHLERAGYTTQSFGYVQFPSALLIVFALMFLAVAAAPRRNRNLIPYGVLLKVSYCAVAFYYWFTIDVPSIWKPFAVIDLAMAVLFIWAYMALRKEPLIVFPRTNN